MSFEQFFRPQSATVRNSETVLVVREVSPQGTVIYRKRFKASGFDVWAQRENRFFSLFSLKQINQVVLPETIKNTEQGGVAEVVTFDAGLTIEEWLQIKVTTAAHSTPQAVFNLDHNLVRLTRACLSALFEIHRVGIIHCDIKPDNICLPYTPKSIAHQLDQFIRVDFDHIRLIDFSFSLSPDVPLGNQVLPLDSRSSYAEYLAPAFKEALLHDQQLGRPEKIAALDYRVDLYSLAFMLNRMLNQLTIKADAEALLRNLVSAFFDSASIADMPHQYWISQLDDYLRNQEEQVAFQVAIEPKAESVYQAPATPLIATPIIAVPVEPSVAPNNPNKPDFSKYLKDKRLLWLLVPLILLLIVVMASSGGKANIEMVKIPDQPYELSKFEITQAQWQKVMGQNPSHYTSCDSCPVESVSWFDVQLFIQKLNEQTGQKYRLPTGIEWEYACFAGTQSTYCGGEDIELLAWNQNNSEEKTHPVGQKKANAFGLYDMSGNVSEWIEDCGDRRCKKRIERGGSWNSRPAESRRELRSDELRSDITIIIEPDAAGSNVGFRLARSVE